MKNLLLFLVALLIPLSLTAQTVDSQSQKLIDEFVKSNIDLQITPVDPVAVSKVFDGTFFKLGVGFIEAAGASSCGDDNYVNINGNTVKMAEGVHMDLECPILLSMIKKGFLLKDEAGAKLFEAALNVLYPLDEDKRASIRHMKKDTQWIFIRDKFFDNYTAFIVSVGPNGAISKIELKLGYAVN
jgi:hypothetical protein